MLSCQPRLKPHEKRVTNETMGMAQASQPLIDIRPFDEKLLEPCISVYLDVFNQPPWGESWTDGSARRRLTKVIRRNGFIGLIAFLDGGPVGFVLGNRWGSYPLNRGFQIRELLVADQVRGTGIGGQLIAALMTNLRKFDLRYISLVTKRGSPAERFYMKSGFKRLPRTGSLNQLVLMLYSLA